jgi:hypothetical protein
MDLREIGWGVWSGFTWLRIGIVDGLLWMRWWTFGFWCHAVSRLSFALLITAFNIKPHRSDDGGRKHHWNISKLLPTTRCNNPKKEDDHTCQREKPKSQEVVFYKAVK